MRKLAFLGAIAGAGLAALLASQRSQAADRFDSPAAAAPSPTAAAPSPTADINDVYTWMDGPKLVLAMAVSAGDMGSQTFGPDVQYVFHVHSKEQLEIGAPDTGIETRIICTFASDTSSQCWVTDGATVKDYIAGDPSAPTGVISQSGKLHLFAGRRAAPSFFNLQGLRATAAAIKLRFTQNPTVQLDASGCPTNLSDNEVRGIAGLLDDLIAGQPPCGAERDCFATLNAKMIVLQLDPTLVNAGQNAVLGVWASTHAAP